jgi:ADP-ribose pyrophosphatase YjhB (NUDIX family)
MGDERLPYVYCPYCRTELADRFIFGRQRRACPACGFIHFVDPKVGAAVVAEQDGKVVLVRRAVAPSAGAWCLPAGFVESDESPADAAARECLEETGLRVQIIELMHDPRGTGVIIVYRGRVDGGRPEAGDDASEVGLFGPDDLPSDIAFPSNRHVLIRWQRMRRAMADD